MGERYKHQALTEQIIGAFYQVYNGLGYGFLEKVYENALVHTLHKIGLHSEQQLPISVYYDGVVVGEYFADVFVEGLVILELKTVDVLASAHEAQLLNYLRATSIEVGLLLNFGPKPEVKRRAMDNTNKPQLHTT